MPASLVTYILTHGYGVIFILVFLQEIGIPNPVPNELILMYSGYLASAGHFSAITIILVAILADFIGTIILYSIFYLFGLWIVKKRPRWLPVDRIELWKEKISKRGKLGIFIGRLIPYVRGYTSMAAGLLEIPPKIFIPIVLSSAIVWSGGLVVLGTILGNNVDLFAEHYGGTIIIIGVVLGILMAAVIVPLLLPTKKRIKKTPDSNE